RLFGQIRVPDQHVLAEPQVSPERAEGEQQLAHIVEMLLADDTLQRAVALEPYQQQGKRRQATQECARKVVEAENRAVPLRLQRHDPVETRQPECDAEEHQKQRSQAGILTGMAEFTVRVLLTGGSQHGPSEPKPTDQIDQSADTKKRQAQPHELESWSIAFNM